MKKYTILFITLFLATIGSAQQIGDGLAAPYLSDFSDLLKSGVYGGYGTTLSKVPDNSADWNHLFVIRHANTANNHQLQIASSFAENDRLFFRKIAGNLSRINPSWIELATRGANSFVGDQTIGGNLGIGTIKPNSRLDLGSGYGVNGAKLLIYNDDATSELSGTKCGFYMDNFASNNLNLVFPEATSHPGLFTISAKNTSETILKPYFSIAGLTGNIGIGVTHPNNKLDVNGTIHSKEVKVDMIGWSDFVFKKTYSLPTLADVEKHINEKGHLENIPSEEEVVKNGINLGEMNARLLQKIEELTLYSIEQAKEIRVLKEENKSFKNLSERLSVIEQKIN